MNKIKKHLFAHSLIAVFTLALFAMTNADLNTYSIDNTERLDDMEIAHIAYTAGNIDIRYAHLALAISENPEVRNFAQTMIRDHNKVNELALGLLDELGATPKNNSTSRKLMKDAAAMREELMSLKGSAFDKRYAENELAYHQFVNKTVENSFIPSVQNKQFKNLLGQALDIFKVHERHAEKMNRKLMSMN